MEVYFAQNQDSEYLNAIKRDMLAYIDKCDKRILGSFSTLKGHIGTYKAKPMERVDKSVHEKRVGALIDSLNNGEESVMRATVVFALHDSAKKAEYYLSSDGNVYVKA